jgi:hypothetical protein
LYIQKILHYQTSGVPGPSEGDGVPARRRTPPPSLGHIREGKAGEPSRRASADDGVEPRTARKKRPSGRAHNTRLPQRKTPASVPVFFASARPVSTPAGRLPPLSTVMKAFFTTRTPATGKKKANRFSYKGGSRAARGDIMQSAAAVPPYYPQPDGNPRPWAGIRRGASYNAPRSVIAGFCRTKIPSVVVFPQKTAKALLRASFAGSLQVAAG